MSHVHRGYGSEWHLLRYLGYHRQALNTAVEAVTGGRVVDWLDHGTSPSPSLGSSSGPGPHLCSPFRDEEWKGLGILDQSMGTVAQWQQFWPQTGNVPNWDAVGWLRQGSWMELLLVEAKSHPEELQTTCKAKAQGGRPMIESALNQSKPDFGAPPNADWLSPYYQFCNRLATLRFLTEHGVPVRLIHIYFLGDSVPGTTPMPTQSDWSPHLSAMHTHVGLTAGSRLAHRVHEVFLPV